MEGIAGVMNDIEQIVRDHGLQDMPIGLDGCSSEFLVGEALKQRGLTCVDAKRCMFEARMIKKQSVLSRPFTVTSICTRTKRSPQ